MDFQRGLKSNMLHLQMGKIFIGIYKWSIRSAARNFQSGLEHNLVIQESLRVMMFQV